VPALMAGRVASAHSIDDMDLLRDGGMDRLFTAFLTLAAALTCYKKLAT
jgi:hypothetical protein